MRSSITRRPVASPCLLCTLRATATAERSIPRTTSRRRFNRRVHSSANRFSGEHLASRPEPEDGGLHSLSTAQKPPSFAGFGNTRTASIAQSKWGKKPAKPIEQPPPAPPPPEPVKVGVSYLAQQTGTYRFRPSGAPGQPTQETIATDSVERQAKVNSESQPHRAPDPFTLENLSQFIESSKVESHGQEGRGVAPEVELQNAERIQPTGDKPEADALVQEAPIEAQATVEAEHNQEVASASESVLHHEAPVFASPTSEAQDVRETSNTDIEAPVGEASAPVEQELLSTPSQQSQENIQLPTIEAEAPPSSLAETPITETPVIEQQTQNILPIEAEVIAIDTKVTEIQLDASAPINAAAEIQDIQEASSTGVPTPEVPTFESQPIQESQSSQPQVQDASGSQIELPFETQAQIESTLITEAVSISDILVQGTSNIPIEAAPAPSDAKAPVPSVTPAESEPAIFPPSDARPIHPSQELHQPAEYDPFSTPEPTSFQSATSPTAPSSAIQQPLWFLDISGSAPTASTSKPTTTPSPIMSWAQMERAAMPPTTTAPNKWARAAAEAKASQGLSFHSPAPVASRPLASASTTPKIGSWAAAAESQARQDNPEGEKTLRKQYTERLSAFETPARPEESLTRNAEIKRKWQSIGQGVGKWGVAKKSVFSASDSNDILDQLSGKISAAPQTTSQGRRQTFGEKDILPEDRPQRSFQEFKTAPARVQYGLGMEFGDTNLVDEAFAEAGYVEEVIGSGKKSKKERRRRAEIEARAAQEEAQEWSRRASAKEKDKAKHGRQWATEDDEIDEIETKAQMRERKRLEREQKAKEKAERERQLPPILIPEFVSVSSLARLCKVKLERFTRKMEELGFTETNPDHVLNAEMAGLISMEWGFEPIVDKSHERDLVALPVPADKSSLPKRPPVVTIMGHVDHGKTTILDWLRKSSIVDQEHGGITQHIGAFSVNMPSGRNITFLDTPGHEAFLKMRERGANMTDIIILVVAADDSIMPQTIEAIKHAKAAGVPIIVAINKCDKEDADPERVKSDLAQYDIQIEDVGGDTQVVRVSGKTGLGMEDLEEAVLLQADDIDMRAEATGRMEGWVVETSTKAKGRVATVLVRRGTLRKGDVIVAGTTWARVRNMITDTGAELEEALPGTPVEVDGWRDQPDAGDEILQATTEDKAKSVVEYRLFKEERLQLAKDIEAINESRRLHHEKKEREARLKVLQGRGMDAEEAAAQLPELKEEEKFKVLEVPFIIKADVAGSVEAVEAQILSVANEEVRTTILRTGVGPLTESDIRMAESTGAYCLTFNVPNDPDIMALARFSNVKTIHHTVIYAILDDIKALMSEKLKPTIVKTVLGEAEVLQVFSYNVKKKIMRPFAGCRVYRGTVTKGYKAKVLRNGETVYDGTLESLKLFKKEVKEISQGSECGMGFLEFDDFQTGDIVHCYTEVKKKRVFN